MGRDSGESDLYLLGSLRGLRAFLWAKGTSKSSTSCDHWYRNLMSIQRRRLSTNAPIHGESTRDVVGRQPKIGISKVSDLIPQKVRCCEHVMVPQLVRR